ncbi:hypothetical protein HY792_02245 [Candidatus Desantisbacteria bacterium]|nr:hypothetical protein [Candidatus Desantisbacteria bacterium]
MSMNESGYGILCGTIAVIFLIIIRGILYKKWLPSLKSIIEMFLLCAAPYVIILFLFSLFGKPKIDFEQYRIYLAFAAIISIYHIIFRVIEEIKQC